MIWDLVEFFVAMGSIGLALWVLVWSFLYLLKKAREEWSEMEFLDRLFAVLCTILTPILLADTVFRVITGILEAEALGRFLWACSRVI